MKFLPHALAVVVLLGLLSYTATTCYDGRVRQWERERDSLLLTNHVLDSLRQQERRRREAEMRIADSLFALGQLQESQANRSRIASRQSKASADSLKALLQTTTDSIPVLLAIVEQQDSAIGSLHAETRSLRASLALQVRATAQLRSIIDSHVRQHATDSARIRSLEDLVRRAPTSPPKLLGVLPMPSRGVVFVAGAVVGALVHGSLP